MHSFETADDTRYEIRLSLGAIKNVKAATGVDLVNADKPRDGKDVPVVTELFMDLDLLVQVLYVIVKSHTPEFKLSPSDFESLFTGDVIDKAHTAFFEALKDFFRSTRRPALADVITEQEKIVQVAGETQQTELAKLKLPERAKRVIEKTFGEVSISMQDSSEASTSTP